MAFIYFDIKHAIQVQDFIIENSGGRKGILNIGLIESVLEHIKNDLYYPSIEDKVCHLFYSINKNHAFNDGNKRSSIALSSYFMEINALGFKVDHFIKEMENIAVHVADNKVSKELLFEIIDSVIHQDDYSEELKLKIFNALSSNDNDIEDNLF
ncbi:type II toxin-antitoxin system death-on-curing family toxin [Flavobacterium sp. RHBU_3]|uniref:type II toxin-antitoxin system death-on-curing family toxin n=1 Tax=Flavobacterium sp. RHBU_3 TaxID=3391184 RepID=UPI003984B4A0